MVGHSKGSAVVDVWMKNHPDFGGKSTLYATPYEDVLGKEEWKDRLNTFNTVKGRRVRRLILEKPSGEVVRGQSC